MTVSTLAIFGVSGRTGTALAAAAVERGWAVRGLARPGSPVPAERRPGVLPIVRGVFTDVDGVIEAVGGADAVCCAIGPRPPHTEVFCAAATRAIIDAMRQTGSRRLVCQTGAMIGPGNRTVMFDWLASSFARRQPAAAQDRVEQERLIQECGLDWTLVKPPRLRDGPARRGVKAGAALRVGLLSSVSRAALAGFMLDAIECGRHIGARVFVKE